MRKLSRAGESSRYSDRTAWTSVGLAWPFRTNPRRRAVRPRQSRRQPGLGQRPDVLARPRSRERVAFVLELVEPLLGGTHGDTRIKAASNSSWVASFRGDAAVLEVGGGGDHERGADLGFGDAQLGVQLLDRVLRRAGL
jgi:hypothetical protein